MASKDDIIADLRRLVEKLTKRIEELELQLAKAQKDSSNSSKSPSSDIVKPPKEKGDRRKKVKRGGQTGHPRKLRELLQLERIDEQITFEFSDSDISRLKLTPTDEFQTVQHIELLDMPIYVTEYRLREYLDCDGNVLVPDVPDLINRPIFGPRMLSMIGWLKSRAHCSYTTIETWMEDVLQVPVSRGYLAKLCTGVISDSLADSSSYDMSQDYSRFMFEANVEPTNNHSEQQVRHCVIDRRITLSHHPGDTQRDGERYNERMWSAIATCTKQNRSFFEYLHASIIAGLSAKPAPSPLFA